MTKQWATENIGSGFGKVATITEVYQKNSSTAHPLSLKYIYMPPIKLAQSSDGNS